MQKKIVELLKSGEKGKRDEWAGRRKDRLAEVSMEIFSIISKTRNSFQ